MSLYTPHNWFDIAKLCKDDVKSHPKEDLLVSYEAYERLINALEDALEIAYNVDTYGVREEQTKWAETVKALDEAIK